jgi:hypothetical protein
MIPTKSSKVLPTIVGIVVLIFTIKNPEGAAHAVTSVIDAIDRFSSAL